MFFPQTTKKRADLQSNNNGTLQRKCKCGKPIVKNGECAECNKKREEKARHAANVNNRPDLVNADAGTSTVAKNSGLINAGHKFRGLNILDKHQPLIVNKSKSGATEKMEGIASDSGRHWTAEIKSVSHPIFSKGGMLTAGPVNDLSMVNEDESKMGDTTPMPAPAPGVTPPSAPPPATPADAGTCTYKITYANITKPGCPSGKCGAKIIYDVTKVEAVGSSCPSLKGLRVTESVTTDNGCTPGGVNTGAGCPIEDNGEVKNCTDTYAFCTSDSNIKEGGCTEIYTQKLFVGGVLAETRHITFKFTKSGSSCSGTVDRT